MPNRNSPFSFSRTSFINPRIIQDLSGLMSDNGDQIVAINLQESQKSNRYAGDTQVRNLEDQNPFVYTENITVENGETNYAGFGYQFVGVTSSRVYLLVTSDWGGGSGVFNSLLLVKFETDKSITCDSIKESISPKNRLLIKKLGEIALGDRWDGQLKVIKNSVFISKDRGWVRLFWGIGGRINVCPPKRLHVED
jgi:hypothetical protein